MRTVALASGSNGNAIYVETRDARLLFDAGLPGKRLAARADLRGVDLNSVDALLLSHDHSDHVCGAGVAHRRFGMPIHATRGTWGRIRSRMGKVHGPNVYRAGAVIEFGGTRVTTVPTPHDGREGVAFVVDDGAARLGILTDLGHPFEGLGEVVSTLDGAYLEANYDREMLENGRYPLHLKRRIAGPGGHLSNRECVELAGRAAEGRLRLLIQCHLSGENNTPETARAAAQSLVRRGVRVEVATRDAPSDFFRIGG